ncbi:hypothetical protein [Gallibacterium anatis]|uniref:hypothetical protein n=1 Tax=Gallibacterium anatis TaxID=750 RepID=UPI000531FC00|nr:hypothetical protein [Gallibacterium anatis]KGQ44092.1 hypothetical protein JP29_09620 [Gallibacterium anatis]
MLCDHLTEEKYDDLYQFCDEEIEAILTKKGLKDFYSDIEGTDVYINAVRNEMNRKIEEFNLWGYIR